MASKRALARIHQKALTVEPDGKDAKRYQVRELRDMLRKHGIGFDPDE
jgi:hypothetical protein